MPAICDLEVLASLRGMILATELSNDQALEVLEDYVALRLRRRDHRVLMLRILELRDNFTPYDAAYVALAERLDATLVTCDMRLTRAAQQFTGLNVVGVSD